MFGRRPVGEDVARLRERAEHLRLVTDAVPALISYVDAEGRYRFVNGRYPEWFGQDAPSLLGRHVRDVLGARAFEHIRPHMEAALAGEARQFEVGIPRQGAPPRLVHAHYVPDVNADGAVAGYYALITDVTERKRAERALRESERRLATLMSNLPGMAYRCLNERPGTAEFVSDGARQLTGWEPADFVAGRVSWVDMIHADDAALVRETVQGAVHERRPYQIEYRITHRDGSERWVWEQGEPVFERDGTVALEGFVTDTTLRRHAEDEQKRAEKTLRDADRRKDEFLATLAHELRNPLAAIHSALGVLVHLPENAAEETGRLTAIMERQVSLMVHLIDDLLDVSRISHGKLELRRRRLALASIVEQAVEAARPEIERERQELTVTMPDETIELQGDPVRIAQVLGNLLSNASRHTPPGGRIALGVERDGSHVVLRVRDDGAGIPADQLETIFEMFSQLAPSRRDAPPGLGVGLTLSRHLVELHGGRLTAHSPGPGQGSEFVVRLPAPAGPPARESDRGNRFAAADGDDRGRRILVVDDNVDAADALAALLSLEGHIISTAQDGRRAIELARTLDPDVVLLDIGMPEMTGFDVCRTIRSQPWGRSMLVIALTGWGQDQDKQSTADAGFDAHLTKPADLAELRRLLTTVARGEPEERRLAEGDEGS